MSKKLSYEDAAEHLHEFIKTCDVDTLAAMYAYAFDGQVESCYDSNEEDCLIIEYYNGLEE